MHRLIAFLQGLCVVAITALSIVAATGYSPNAALGVAAAFFCLGVLAVYWPMPSIWLTQFVGKFVVAVAIMGLIGMAQLKSAHDKTVAQERKEVVEAELQALRSSDPETYLARLKDTGDGRWLSELKALDAEGHRAVMKSEIDGLEKTLAAVPSWDLDEQHKVLYRLASIDPENKKTRQRREAVKDAIQMRDYPHLFVTLDDFKWSKGGFGSVFLGTFVLRNKHPREVKDITIKCTLFGSSGTQIDSVTKTIYQRVPPNKTKRISELNMGFMHNQGSRASCSVTGVVIS